MKDVRLQVDRIINSTDPSYIVNQKIMYPSTTPNKTRNNSSIRQKRISYAWDYISANCTLQQIYVSAETCEHLPPCSTHQDIEVTPHFSHILCPPRSTTTKQAPYRKKTGLFGVDVLDWVLPALWTSAMLLFSSRFNNYDITKWFNAIPFWCITAQLQKWASHKHD